jgi:hypothetical protein
MAEVLRKPSKNTTHKKLLMRSQQQALPLAEMSLRHSTKQK